MSLKIKLANKLFKTSFSLAERGNTLFPVLVGRTALRNRYLVDVNKSSVKTEKLLKNFGHKPTDFEEGMD